MIDVKCDRCHEPLDEPGGLAFTPPGGPGGAYVRKYHICVVCWWRVLQVIEEKPE